MDCFHIGFALISGAAIACVALWKRNLYLHLEPVRCLHPAGSSGIQRWHGSTHNPGHLAFDLSASSALLRFMGARLLPRRQLLELWPVCVLCQAWHWMFDIGGL